MTMSPMRAVVIDDEPLARQAIQQFLTEVDWLAWAGEAGDGPGAIVAIQQLQPDLVFLDIQMPGATGIQVLERAKSDVAVIFTTAFDEYAMTAFELGAIDYLRKPFGRERFIRALERARPFLEARRVARDRVTSVPLGERLKLAQQHADRLTRIFVRDRANIIPVQVGDVLRCEADGDYVAVMTAERRHLVYINLADLSARLDPERFVRIHRSHIINLDHVAAMVAHDANRLEVRMQDGTRVVASRAGTQLLRARFK